MQDYRKLKVWNRAYANAIAIRDASNQFPRTGYQSLRTQMTSAAESVVFNIAEGCGSRSAKDFARFLDISIKSTIELETELKLAKDYRILKIDAWHPISEENETIRKMLCGLRKKVLSSDNSR